MIATGISIDLKGGILVGMSERMNATILPRTRKAQECCGETLARSQLGIHESDVVSNVTKSNRPVLAWLKKGVKARDSLSFVTKLSPLNSRLSETFPFLEMSFIARDRAARGPLARVFCIESTFFIALRSTSAMPSVEELEKEVDR